MNSQEWKDLTAAAQLIGEVYAWAHELDEQEAHRLIEALDIIEGMLEPVKTARAIPARMRRHPPQIGAYAPTRGIPAEIRR